MSNARGVGARQRLSRASVVTEAIDFVDENGLPALTMRRLGRRLGVEAMSLYRYVNGREDLLEAMVDDLVGRLRRGKSVDLPNDTWQAYVVWLAHAVRAMAVEHPHLFPLVATRHPSAPWLRPPLRSLEVVEEFLATMTDRGFSPERAVRAYQMFTTFLLGHLLLESTHRSTSPTMAEEQLEGSEAIEAGVADATTGAGSDAVQHAAASGADSAASAGSGLGPDSDEELSEYPHIEKFADLLTQERSDEEFEEALEVLIGRLETTTGLSPM